MTILPNARQERFAQLLASGKSADEAYAAAGYRANRGNAATLKANQSIRKRLAELQDKAAERNSITIERLTDMLIEDRTMARELGQSAAAVSATEKLGRLHGFFIERSENVNHNYNISDEPMTDDEWAEQYATEH